MHYPHLTQSIQSESSHGYKLNILVDHLPPSQLSPNISSLDLLHIIFINEQRKIWVTMIYKANDFCFFSLVLQRIRKNEFHCTKTLESVGVELNPCSLALASQLLQLIQSFFIKLFIKVSLAHLLCLCTKNASTGREKVPSVMYLPQKNGQLSLISKAYIWKKENCISIPGEVEFQSWGGRNRQTLMHAGQPAQYSQ